MAKVKFGGGVSEIRGSIAGTVFSKNANGSIMRNKTNPTNPQSPRQMVIRAAFGGIAAGWRNLSVGNRQSFTDQAPAYPYTDSLGNTLTYTGQQLFQKHNLDLISVNFAQIVAQLPPFGLVPLTADGTDLQSGGPGTFEITNLGATTVNEAILVECTPPMSSGISNPGNRYRAVAVKPVSGAAGVLDILNDYENAFGIAVNTLTLGDLIYVRCSKVDKRTGEVSPYLILKAIVA